MRKGIFVLLLIAAFGTALANETRDLFKGKLFPPNLVLEYRSELDLSREQFKAVRTVVVEVQAQVAEHEWDMQEAYAEVLQQLERKPIDEQLVSKHVQAVLSAENKVKLAQMGMLVRIRNLLTDEQIAFLEANWAKNRK